ncbi:hypothetical protein RIF29_41736 [Crotalaria pallida]|uniref:GATA-type domain-containing protein n=1 Tax=Crotalaria pallida TaxID=3830 RepID=A0AAN9E6Z5_CROPI
MVSGKTNEVIKNSEVESKISPSVEVIPSETSQNVIKGGEVMDDDMKKKDGVITPAPSRRGRARARGGSSSGKIVVLMSLRKRSHRRRVILPVRADRICTNIVCRTRETTLWRRGPLGPHTLCNACGIHFNKKGVYHLIIPDDDDDVLDANADVDVDGAGASARAGFGAAGEIFLYFVHQMKHVPPKYN